MLLFSNSLSLPSRPRFALTSLKAEESESNNTSDKNEEKSYRSRRIKSSAATPIINKFNSEKQDDFNQLLEKELSQFQSFSQSTIQPSPSTTTNTSTKLAPNIDDKEENSIFQTIKNAFSTILIIDFFVVIIFLVWFILAALLKGQNYFILYYHSTILQYHYFITY